MSKKLKALGLMSGTSLDGIDIALLETDGENRVGRGPFTSFSYTEDQQKILRQALVDAVALHERGERPASLGRAEALLTEWHAEIVLKFLRANRLHQREIDVIGFHGQTVLHRPDEHLTVQLGDGVALAKATRINVVYDMRAADVASGGQGAPLVPAYHAALAPIRPCAFINIGGVANVTFIGSDGMLLAFDTGPGNALINDWMLKHSGTPIDLGGETALKGSVSGKHLQQALAHPYFSQQPPKSLDRNAFAGLNFDGLSLADGAATLSAFTVESIVQASRWMPETPKQWIICGGGRLNEAIMRGLRAQLSGVMMADSLGFNGDAMEAEAWAYLAVRSLRHLPLTYPGTTGTPQALTGGIIVRPEPAPVS